MKNICPNINDPSWIALEKAVGRFEAMKDFMEYDGEIRSPEEVLAKLTGISKGVLDVFKLHPELSSIGTPKQYSQYLDTIFPDSKVKDIVYHGTDAKFDKFLKEFAREDRPYFYFSFVEEANMYKESREGSYLYSVVLNVKNYAKGYTPDELEIDTVENLKKQGYDAVAGRGWSTREEIAVFEPEQIHILGSKQDIEGFKNWVFSGQPEVNYQLKAVNILQSDKAKQVFEKGKKNNWDLDRILTELQIPKEQKQLILDNVNNLTPIFNDIKPGVSELFESNPELANAVYEALGFVRSDKVLSENYENYFSEVQDMNSAIFDNLENADLLYTHYEIKEIDINNLDLSKKTAGFSDNASDYLKDELISVNDQKTPILINGRGEVVEGWHRIHSLKANDIKTVKAYVPVTPQQKQQAQQQYSQYLDTIFPDSKVKDIVYHGSKNTTETGNRFDTFDIKESWGTMFSFTKRRGQALNYARYNEKGIYQVLLNIKNPTIEIDDKIIEKPINNDGYITDYTVDYIQTLDEHIVDFKIEEINVDRPEQIHILGSKKDVEGFKEFVKTPQQFNLREQLALELASNYSYAVEVNTAKDNNYFDPDSSPYVQSYKDYVATKNYDGIDNFETEEKIIYLAKDGKTNKTIKKFDTEKEAQEFVKSYKTPKNTSHYSNLTVPGGTNYTENEIATPGQLVEEKPKGISVKEGVSELFNSNPELANIGTPEQYSQYLSTVFPDSKVKDIVYHFSTVKIEKPNKEKFSLSANINRRKGFFGINKKINPGNNFANIEGTIPHAMLFNMKNPDFGDFSILPPITAKDETKDSAIIKQRGDTNYYAVFEPEQIHILGSKEDIDGFNKWIKSNTKTERKNAIVPSIKGHAAFSTNSGIGWFRSDDKIEFLDKEDLIKKGIIKQVPCG